MIKRLLSALFILFCGTVNVLAWTHGTSTSNFNNGAVQTNLNFVQEPSAFAFVDLAKSGSTITDSNGAVAATNIDVNGYPLSGTWSKGVSGPLPQLKPGDYIMMWTGGGPNTVMRSPGGTFVSSNLPGAGLTGANGIYRFTPSAAGHQAVLLFTLGVQITGASYSPVTSLSLVHVNDYAAWQADPNAFSPEIIAAYAAGKFGFVRFLNWQGNDFNGANAATWTDWTSRKPLTYNNFSGEEWRPNWWAGNPDNGGSGNDYTLTTPSAPTYIFGNGAPVDKQIMHVRFNQNATLIQSSTVTFTGNTVNWSGHTFTGNEPISLYKVSANLPTGLWNQTYYVVGSSVVAGVSFQISLTPGGAAISSFGTGASGNYGGVRLPTLNINGTGAVPITNTYGDPITTTGSLPGNSGTATYGTLQYDADLKTWMKFGGSQSGFSQGVTNGVPPELLLKFAIQTRSAPYFVSSAFALDPMTDFWPTFAAYVRDNSPSWMRGTAAPRYEGCNENWNFATNFFCTRYAWNKAWAHWQTQFDQNNFQGKTISTLGQAVQAVYGGLPDGTKYKLINGMQSASAYNGAILSVTDNNSRLNATQYVAQSAPAQSGYVKGAAYKSMTHVAPANYNTSTQYKTLQELQTAILYSATNRDNPTARTANLNSFVSGLVAGSATGSAIFTSGSPGVVNWPSHGLTTNNRVIIYTQGTLFSPLIQYRVYWVTVVDADHLNLAASQGGALINFTGSQAGNHTITQVFTNGFNNGMVASQSWAFQNWAAGFTNDAGNPIGLTFYEGLWSPDTTSTGGQEASQTVSAITAPGATTTVTVGANTTLVDGTVVSGVGAQVGGAVSFSSVGGMTQLNTSNFNTNFAGGGSANITSVGSDWSTPVANSLILNQAVSFDSGGNFKVPDELVAGSPYYVVSTGNPFQISKTRGGPAITFAGAANTFNTTASPGWFVTAIGGVGGQDLTLDVNSSTFGTYTSGGTLTYNRSLKQTNTLRVDGRLAPDLEGLVYGNTWPLPSLFASITNIGGIAPSKYLLNGSFDVWSSLQPNIYVPYPTTGEWKAIQSFSPLYNFLLKRDMQELEHTNDNSPMWLEKAA